MRLIKGQGRLIAAVGVLLCAVAAHAQPAQDDATQAEADVEQDLDFLFSELEPPQQADADAPASNPAVTRSEAETYPDVVVLEDRAPQVKPKGVRSIVEEIIVTAQKREESIQDVPISISAFSGEKLDIMGITNPEKLVLVTPGLIYDSVNNFALIYLRGVGTDAFLPHGSPSVATYIDGVYFPFIHESARGLGEVERIEVLKGPQGTLFGVNTTGGAISITTKAPVLDEYSAAVQASYGSYNKQDHKAYANIPLGNTLALSVGALYQSMDEVYKPAEGSPVDSFRDFVETGGRVKLRWQPSDRLDFVLTGVMTESDGTGTALYDMIEPHPAGQALTSEGGDYIADLSMQPYSTSEGYVTYLNSTYSADWMDIRSITAYQNFLTTTVVDYDGSREDLVGINANPQVSSTFSQELQFLSGEAGPTWLKWTAGLNYFTNEQGFERLDFLVGPTDNPFDSICLNALCTPDLSSLLGNPALRILPKVVGMISADAISAFLHTEWEINSWLGVTLAGRYQRETRKLVDSRVVAAIEPDSLNPDITALNYSGREQTTSNFSPKVSLNLSLADDTLLFFSWQQGFKSATFNIVNLYDPPDPVLPEKINTFELGFKTRFLDGRMQLNAAIFENQIEDLQTQFISFVQGGVTSLENAAEVLIRGAELDFTWGITNWLSLSTGAAYLESEFQNYPNASGFNEITGVYQGTLDFSGNRTPRTPKITSNTSIVMTGPLGPGVIELGGDYYYNSGFYFDNQNTAEQKAYSIVNVRLSYLFEESHLRLTAYGDNLTSAIRHQNNFVNDFGVVTKLIPPATYGVRLNWEFY